MNQQNYIFRLATINDALSIAKLQIERLREVNSPENLEVVYVNIEIERRTLKITNEIEKHVSFFLIEYNALIIGYSQIVNKVERNSLEAELFSIYLLPKFRNNGKGKLLLNKTFEYLVEMGTKTLQVSFFKEFLYKEFFINQKAQLLRQQEVTIGKELGIYETYCWFDLQKIHNEYERTFS